MAQLKKDDVLRFGFKHVVFEDEGKLKRDFYLYDNTAVVATLDETVTGWELEIYHTAKQKTICHEHLEGIEQLRRFLGMHQVYYKEMSKTKFNKK